MKKLNSTFILWLTLSLFPIQFAFGAEGVAIIVNGENKQELTEQQIKNIYADIVTEWDNGGKIIVYNLPVDEEAREIFSQKIFGESASRLAGAEANRKITNTIKNPSITKSARLVIKLVSRKPNAVGYVPLSLLKDTKDLRIIMKIE